MKRSKKRWKTEKDILAAIDRKRLLEKSHIKHGYDCETARKALTSHNMPSEAELEDAKSKRHYRRAALISGQLKTLQGKLAEMRTIPLFPEVMGDGSVQR